MKRVRTPKGTIYKVRMDEIRNFDQRYLDKETIQETVVLKSPVEMAGVELHTEVVLYNVKSRGVHRQLFFEEPMNQEQIDQQEEMFMNILETVKDDNDGRKEDIQGFQCQPH